MFICHNLDKLMRDSIGRRTRVLYRCVVLVRWKRWECWLFRWTVAVAVGGDVLCIFRCGSSVCWWSVCAVFRVG